LELFSGEGGTRQERLIPDAARLNEARKNVGDGWREILSFWPPRRLGGHKAESSQD